ncbi:MAG: hypothetical protein PSX37_12670 [bacterium]|nr:hypothetical protein [bacterium]
MTTLAGCSLALWIGSAWFALNREGDRGYLSIGRGFALFVWTDRVMESVEGWPDGAVIMAFEVSPPFPESWVHDGVGVGTPSLRGPARLYFKPDWNWSPGSHRVQVPFWMFAVPIVGLSVWSWVRRARFNRRVRHGACAGCEYELAGSSAKVCPECGKQRLLKST